MLFGYLSVFCSSMCCDRQTCSRVFAKVVGGDQINPPTPQFTSMHLPRALSSQHVLTPATAKGLPQNSFVVDKHCYRAAILTLVETCVSAFQIQPKLIM